MDRAELKIIAREIARYIKKDDNSPYTYRKPHGDIDRFGQQAYRLGKISALTQPFGDKDYQRLPEGQRFNEWRFISVLPPDRIEVGMQINFKDRWFEIKQVQDWDTVAKGHMVRVD